LVALIVAYSFVCATDGRAGDNSLRLDGIDIQLGMSKADLEKRLPGKYRLWVLPPEVQKLSGLSQAIERVTTDLTGKRLRHEVVSGITS